MPRTLMLASLSTSPNIGALTQKQEINYFKSESRMFSSERQLIGNFVRDGTINEDIFPDVAIFSERTDIQSLFPNAMKGWQVPVHHGECSLGYGMAVFAGADIEAGTVLRRGVPGLNLLRIQSKEDLDRLGDNPHVLSYLADYLFGFTDCDDSVEDSKKIYHQNLWVPGCGFNLCAARANVDHTHSEDGTEVHLVAKKKMAKGEQMFQDVSDLGHAPEFMVEWRDSFKSKFEMPLNFKGQNDYDVYDYDS